MVVRRLDFRLSGGGGGGCRFFITCDRQSAGGPSRAWIQGHVHQIPPSASHLEVSAGIHGHPAEQNLGIDRIYALMH